jgi:hypothetical protein
MQSFDTYLYGNIYIIYNLHGVHYYDKEESGLKTYSITSYGVLNMVAYKTMSDITHHIEKLLVHTYFEHHMQVRTHTHVPHSTLILFGEFWGLNVIPRGQRQSIHNITVRSRIT